MVEEFLEIIKTVSFSNLNFATRDKELTFGVGLLAPSRLNILSNRSTKWPNKRTSSSLSFFIALAGMRRERRS